MSKAQKGKTRSEETRKKISDASKGNKNCLGKKASEETKKKQSEAKKGENHPQSKLNWNIVKEIRENIELSRKELAIKYGVCISVISSVLNNTSWKS